MGFPTDTKNSNGVAKRKKVYSATKVVAGLEAYSEPSQISDMTIFAKSSIWDVWLGSMSD